jgi:hypothetical protein
MQSRFAFLKICTLFTGDGFAELKYLFSFAAEKTEGVAKRVLPPGFLPIP